jgi:hypothetical protein
MGRYGKGISNKYKTPSVVDNIIDNISDAVDSTTDILTAESTQSLITSSINTAINALNNSDLEDRIDELEILIVQQQTQINQLNAFVVALQGNS